MSTYLHKNEGLSETFNLTERHIYGSSRLGLYKQPVSMLAVGGTGEFVFDIPGYRQYELTNHASAPLSTGLGNVTSTITAQKVPIVLGGNLGGYMPQIIYSYDYSPFGVTRLEFDVTAMSTTHPVGDGYRYGFQGQEKDDEIKGSGNSVNYKHRMHDPRIGRFFALDPLSAKYPFYSPYAFSGNRVIDAVEQEGLQPTMYTMMLDKKFADPKTAKVTDEDIIAGQIVLGFSPIGVALDVWDLGVALREGDATGIVMAAIGFLPFGDFAKIPGKIGKLTSKTANAGYKYGPYKRGTEILEFKTESSEQFVRVFNDVEGNPTGKWMTKKSELMDANGNILSPEKIKDKLGLEHVPNKIQDVNVPQGTTMRTGIAGEKTNWNSKGGGTQYEALDKLPKESFSKGKNL